MNTLDFFCCCGMNACDYEEADSIIKISNLLLMFHKIHKLLMHSKSGISSFKLPWDKTDLLLLLLVLPMLLVLLRMLQLLVLPDLL